MATLLDDRGFQYCGRARLGGWGVVLLDTHIDGDASAGSRRRSSRVSTRTCARSRMYPCWSALHHPPVPVGSAWLDAVGLQNGSELLAVIDHHPQVRAVLAGHVHRSSMRSAARCDLLATPSTCAQFAPRTPGCVMDRRPRATAGSACSTTARSRPRSNGCPPWRRTAGRGRDAPLASEHPVHQRRCTASPHRSRRPGGSA